MTSAVLYLNPRDLQPDPRNSRSQAGDLAGLAETIRAHGLLQPVGVIPRDGGYQVVYGNRRREAAIAAGLEQIPCLVLDEMGEDDILVRQLLENLQRLDLGDLDKARAFQRALEAQQPGANGERPLDLLAHRLGLSTRQIQRYLALLDLEPEVQTLLELGELGVTQAQHLRPVSPPERQVEVAALAVEEHLSAAELARLCRALAANSNISPADALARLRQGEAVPDLSSPPRSASPAHLPPPPPVKLEEDEEEEDEDFQGEDDREERRFSGRSEGGDPATRDGNRVRKFHTLDSFVDEVDRLVLCAQEGDLARLLADDPTGSVKLRLAARQARYLADRLASLVQEAPSTPR